MINVPFCKRQDLATVVVELHGNAPEPTQRLVKLSTFYFFVVSLHLMYCIEYIKYRVNKTIVTFITLR